MWNKCIQTLDLVIDLYVFLKLFLHFCHLNKTSMNIKKNDSILQRYLLFKQTRTIFVFLEWLNFYKKQLSTENIKSMSGFLGKHFFLNFFRIAFLRQRTVQYGIIVVGTSFVNGGFTQQVTPKTVKTS